MEQNEKKQVITSNGLKLVDLIEIGVMAAIVFVLTSLVHIPSFMGVIHLGDSMIFLSAILLGKKKGAVSSAIGMSLFDILNGYILWAPFTFLIKGTMGYIAGSICHRKKYNGNNSLNNLLGFTIAGVVMILGYYVSGAIMARFLIMKVATIQQAFVIALKDIPGNISQAIGGIIIALPLSIVIKKSLKK